MRLGCITSTWNHYRRGPSANFGWSHIGQHACAIVEISCSTCKILAGLRAPPTSANDFLNVRAQVPAPTKLLPSARNPETHPRRDIAAEIKVRSYPAYQTAWSDQTHKGEPCPAPASACNTGPETSAQSPTGLVVSPIKLVDTRARCF